MFYYFPFLICPCLMDLIPTWRFILFVQTQPSACIHVFVNRCCVALMFRTDVSTRDYALVGDRPWPKLVHCVRWWWVLGSGIPWTRSHSLQPRVRKHSLEDILPEGEVDFDVSEWSYENSWKNFWLGTSEKGEARKKPECSFHLAQNVKWSL